MVGNFGWLSADKAYRLSLSLVVGTWVARYLGPGGYGVMNYGLAMVGLVSVLPTLGLDLILRRELVRRPAEAGNLLGTAFLLRLGSGLATYVLLLFAVRVFEPNPAARLAIAMAGLSLVQQAMLTIDVWFQSQLQSKHTVIAQNAAFTVSSLARVGFILAGARLEWFLILLALDAPLSSGLLVAAYQRGHQRLAGWRWDGALARELLTQSWPLALSSMAALVYLRIDQVLLRHLAGEVETGRYASAVRLAEIIHMGPMMLAASMAPAIAQAKLAGPGPFEHGVRRLLRLAIGLAWAVTLPVCVLAPWLVAILYGQAYAQSAAMLAVLALSVPFIAAGVARQEFLVNEGHMKFQLFTTCLGAGLSVSLNLWWIPYWGGLGAAAALTVTCVVSGLVSSFFWAGTRQLGWWQLDALLTPWRTLTRSRIGQEWWAVRRRRLHELVGSARYSRPSLNGIDAQLEQYLDRDAGFFVEAGAHDGFTQSNTYYLERFRRWHGLLIEPVPMLFARCQRERRSSRSVQAALVGPEYSQPEIELEYGDLMTVVPQAQAAPEAKTRFAEMRAHFLPDCQPFRFKAPARTLSSLLDEHTPGQTVDLLSLDVEGYELEALRGLDLSRHRPGFICVETWNKPAVDALLTPFYVEVAVLHSREHLCDVLYRLRSPPAKS